MPCGRRVRLPKGGRGWLLALAAVAVLFASTAPATAQTALAASQLRLDGTTADVKVTVTDCGGGSDERTLPISLTAGAGGAAIITMSTPNGEASGPVTDAGGGKLTFTLHYAGSVGDTGNIILTGSGTSFSGTGTFAFPTCTATEAIQATLPGTGLTVVAAATTTIPATSTTTAGATTATTASATSGGSRGGGGGHGAVKPSSVSATLPTPAQATKDVANTLVNAVIAVGVMLFITFPAEIFNKTFDENYDDIRAWAVNWRSRLTGREQPAVAGEENSTRATRAVKVAVVLVAGAVLGTLVSPHIKADRTTLLSFAGTFVAFAIVFAIVAGAQLRYRAANRVSGESFARALPAGLVVAAACVVVSRLVRFRPGYIYGVICGVGFSSEMNAADEGRDALTATVTTLALGMLGWLLWIPVSHLGGSGALSTVDVFGRNVVSTVVASSIVGAVLGLLPLRFLPGGAVAVWSRRVWAIVFALGVFSLLTVLLHPASGPAHPGHASIVTAVLLFVVFGAASIAFRQHFARKRSGLVVAAAHQPPQATSGVPER